MKVGWPDRRRLRAAWGAVAAAAIVAIGARWLERWRPPPPDRMTSIVFRVTSGADSGPGSLREAIFAADRASARARIVVAAAQVTLESPLPPLVNPFGVIVEAERAGEADIDASRSPGVALDIAAPGSVVSGLRIRGGRAGVVVRARGALLRAIELTEGGTGVLVAAGAADTNIVDARFRSNRIGVQLTDPNGKTTVRNSRFEDHATAGIWAVVPANTNGVTDVTISDNRFRDDAAGIIAVNVGARIQRNVFDDQRGSAVQVSDARVAIGDNRIRSGRGFGVFAERLSSGLLSNNEITRNCAGGVMLRRTTNTRIVGNQIYRNGYGIVMMQGAAESPNTVADNLIADQVGDGLVLIGVSPIVARNRLLQNRLAGLRLSGIQASPGRWLTPLPLLADNVLLGNGLDAPQRDDYQSSAGPAGAQPMTDCNWRTGGSSAYAVPVGARQ